MSNGNGGGGGFDFGGFFDPLLGVLAAIIDAIIQFLNALVNVLVQILNFLYQGELGIFDFTRRGTDSIWHIFKQLLDDAFKLHVIKALHDLRDLYAKLQAWVKKIKAWIERFRKLQQLYQVQAFKRFINLIQRIRKVLILFRLLHLKFATKLDNWLAQIEGKLIQRTVDYARKTNEIIGWMNWILDPRALFNAGPWFGTARRSLTGILGAAQALGFAKLFPQLVSNPGGTTPTVRWAEWTDRFDMERATDSGLYGEFKRSTLDLTDRITKELGT